MNIRTIDEQFSVTGQIEVSDMPTIAAAGFKKIICNRPDHEAAGQPTHDSIGEAAAKAGISLIYIPLAMGQSLDFEPHELAKALAASDGPVLGYCKSGARAANLYELAKSI